MNSKNVQLRLELMLPSEQILSMLTVHHESIQKQVQEGVDAAIAEIVAENDLVDHIKSKVKDAIYEQLVSWTVDRKVRDIIKTSYLDVVEQNSFEVAELISEGLSEITDALKDRKKTWYQKIVERLRKKK